MGLFPQSFIEDLRAQADIVQVVQDHVPLKRSGANYRGLCPFHSEKTPSFNVNREKGFFHCFGCGLGGDVFKFLELHEKLAFPDAVRQLAQRFGLTVPDLEDARRDQSDEAEREALLKVHEMAAAYFEAQLAGPAGASARSMLRERGLREETIARLRLGLAPVTRDALKLHLLKQGFPRDLLVRSGLVMERESGETIDRFRSRLMIPICRQSGSIIAFGGRALEEAQQPKYLNSPETAIYSKSRTLYGLHLTKGELRRLGYAVLVEGYFDFAQVLQAGVAPAVASCGTALTPAQAHILRRFVSKVILSFDPDEAGQGAARRSCELLVAQGFQVNVAILPTGEDPDTFLRRHGATGYAARLRNSRPYLEYLLDQAAEGQDLESDLGRRSLLANMLAVAAQIPDAAARDQFADRLAHKARILEEVVRSEIRKAAAGRRTSLPGLLAVGGQEAKPAEKGLLWALVHTPAAAQEALAGADQADLEGLRTTAILQTAHSLREWPAEGLPETLFERLSKEEAELVRGIAAQAGPPASADECVRALKRLRYERERGAVQREIDRLQELGAARNGELIDALWTRKKDLLQRIEALTS